MTRPPRRPGRTRPPQQTPGQLDLLTGNPAAPAVPQQRGSTEDRPPINDMDLIRDIAGNAARGMYLVVGASDRVYAHADGPDSVEVVRVARFEERAVHQLLTAGLLTLGGRLDATCGAASLVGTHVTCPKTTKTRLARWEALARPTTWPTPPRRARRCA